MKLKNSEVIVVCGKNEELKEDVLYFKRKNRARNIHVLGFVNNVYELLFLSGIQIVL